MTKEEIIEKLIKMHDELDKIQETSTIQEDEETMNEIGEAMGYIDNAISSLEE